MLAILNISSVAGVCAGNTLSNAVLGITVKIP
jgi:hypothetical protein